MWDPAICNEVLSLVALPEEAMVGGLGIGIGELPGLRRHIVTEKKVSHLLLEQAGRRLQMEIRGGGSLTGRAQLFMEAVASPGLVRSRLGGLTAFNCLLRDGEFPKMVGETPGCDVRLKAILRSFDGYRSGLSQREIAIELFGQSRVDTDWGRGSDHMKSRVRRLIRRGKWLVDGGYLTLLR